MQSFSISIEQCNPNWLYTGFLRTKDVPRHFILEGEEVFWPFDQLLLLKNKKDHARHYGQLSCGMANFFFQKHWERGAPAPPKEHIAARNFR